LAELIKITVPDIGGAEDVEIIELSVQPGDVVDVETPLMVVESDKASMEIPSPVAGRLTEFSVSLGDKVSEGSPIAVIDVSTSEPSADKEPSAGKEPSADKRPSADKGPSAVDDPVTHNAPAARNKPTASASLYEVMVPDIGGAADVEVIEISAEPGDQLEEQAALIVVETDKASMEIPVPVSGTLVELKVSLGDKINEGTLIALVRQSVESESVEVSFDEETVEKPSARAEPFEPNKPEPVSPATSVASAASAVAPTTGESATLYASPSVRKFARELGVSLKNIQGTGPRQRLTKEDVRLYVKNQMETQSSGASSTQGGGLAGLIPWPEIDFAKFGEIERVKRSKVQLVSAAALHRNWVTIPHVTNNEEADITELEAFRQQLNLENPSNKVSMIALLMKACVAALKTYPQVNSSLDGDELVLKHYYHIGFAADTPQGLLVPVVRDVDKKGIFEISAEIKELAGFAREGKLKPNQMQGGTFSISSLGNIGGGHFTPIINAPEVAILGVGKSRDQLKRIKGEIEDRLILPLSLSWDHRAIDGALAGKFNACLAASLEDLRRALL